MESGYQTIEEAYKTMVTPLVAHARKRLINKDEAIDAVHDAFEYITGWKRDHPDQFIKTRLAYRIVERKCYERNKKQKEFFSFSESRRGRDEASEETEEGLL